ncbi:hypothetical protein PGTUg99_034997 [Puccinia graminis f. sp. tritici]|uniref:Uncharacterized protein n=1 Tax=Puccinia graminis f. sp. tritici TaxID=56615 RepID=A0A5B0P796_PUCGR|nr:hypothetical protein PGTUg99_034997 [Puccinia graminis f. sp. tritici]
MYPHLDLSRSRPVNLGGPPGGFFFTADRLHYPGGRAGKNKLGKAIRSWISKVITLHLCPIGLSSAPPRSDRLVLSSTSVPRPQLHLSPSSSAPPRSDQLVPYSINQHHRTLASVTTGVSNQDRCSFVVVLSLHRSQSLVLSSTSVRSTRPVQHQPTPSNSGLSNQDRCSFVVVLSLHRCRRLNPL